MSECKFCGQEISYGTDFCPYCGKIDPFCEGDTYFDEIRSSLADLPKEDQIDSVLDTLEKILANLVKIVENYEKLDTKLNDLENRVVSAALHIHSFSEAWSNDASQHWHGCSCGAKSDATDHTFGEWIVTKEPTCSVKGSKKRICSICGYEDVATIETLSHTPVVDAAVEPTCTEDGLTEGIHCSVCNTVLTAQKTVPAIGHSIVTWATADEPTCIAKGREIGVCSVCGTIETRDIPALGHNYVKTVVPPTVAVNGYTEYKCTRCDHSYREVIEATGSQGFTYENHGNGTCKITSRGSCTDTDVYIPSKIDNLKVIAIGEKVFYRCTSLRSISIPESVESIHNDVFYGCTNLKTITFLCNGYLGIHEYAFGNCTSLRTVSFPDGLAWIGPNAFTGCESLLSITVPSSLRQFGNFTFSECGCLDSINYNGTKAQWQKISQYRSFSPTNPIVHCIDGDCRAKTL